MSHPAARYFDDRHVELENLLSDFVDDAMKSKPSDMQAFLFAWLLRRQAKRHEASARLHTIVDVIASQLQEVLEVESLVKNGVDDRETARTLVQQALIQSEQIISGLSKLLEQLSDEQPSGSRSTYLETIGELVGPEPEREWQEEWAAMVAETNQLDQNTTNTRADSIEQLLSSRGQTIETMERLGWPANDARDFLALQFVKPALGAALQERDPRYAASTYQLCRVVHHRSEQATPPPALYTHLRGPSGLIASDASWESLLTPDSTGFQGFACMALTTADCDPCRFDERGHMARMQPAGPVDQQQPWPLVPVDSEVLLFESAPNDWKGSHAAIVFSDDPCLGVFPPNTLFRLKEIRSPGEWEAPGGVRPRQRLLVVSATYRSPVESITVSIGDHSRYSTSHRTLTFHDRRTYVRGLDALIAKPPLTMELEFQREQEWECNGPAGSPTRTTLRAEWEYVNGPARSAGKRDAGKEGWTPERFREDVNDFIRKRAGMQSRLPHENALLTLDEVLAVRLYSGPSYTPINDWLRQVGKLQGKALVLANYPALSFAATVRHLMCALRKLAAVATAEEARTPLWRGVTGRLPAEFSDPDAAGVVCAVDMAFVSTSRKWQTPIDYMTPETANVLWCLHPEPESDVGFHCGADIKMLSQFAAEDETLFPPCTMFQVVTDNGAPLLNRMDSVREEEAMNRDGKAVRYKAYNVRPSFV